MDLKGFCEAYYSERSLNDSTFDPDACTKAALKEAERRGVEVSRAEVSKIANKAFDKALKAY
jgi:hypothetical protein